MSDDGHASGTDPADVDASGPHRSSQAAAGQRPTFPGAETDRRSPWRTVSSEPVYANDWIRVRHDEVIRPDGSPGVYGVVSTAHAVGVVALTAADEIVMIGQWRYTLGTYSWEIVEGGVDDGEAPLDAARRELAEEAGYAAQRWSVLVPEIAVSNSVTDERATIFLVEDLRPVPTDPDPTEVLERREVPVADVLEAVDAGQVTDALTLIAVAALDRVRRR